LLFNIFTVAAENVYTVLKLPCRKQNSYVRDYKPYVIKELFSAGCRACVQLKLYKAKSFL